eukprot:augustus_masked-scaffold_2-processed-gene-3.48-mRNA-1 protein AED:0.01 eAED:0.02 QI:0/-1/0/1/-1/1/1/0/1176
MPTFSKVPEKPNFPEIECQISGFWKEIDAFQESLRQSSAENRKPFTFYDGPPFATGLPHYGHLLAGTIKDIVTRFAHQTGHHVERRFGWDCHGLPVEYEIDKKLGIKSSEDVQKLGIEKYNDECRGIVSRYTNEWRAVVTRLGRWIDFDNDYKTMDKSFMESVWWVFKTIYDKNLVYKGFRVMPYSTGCTTPLSNFEAGLNYKDTSDPAVFIRFRLRGETEQNLVKVFDEELEGASFVAWTTTPWTLPSNLGLAVHPEFDYVLVKDKETGEKLLFLECRVNEIYPVKKNKKKKEKTAPKYDVLKKFKGTQLEGIRYEPLFNYFVKDFETKGYRVVVADYVTDDSGTGIVHQAPAFGEIDFDNCLKNGIIEKSGFIPCPVDADGNFTDEVTDFAGVYVKEADKLIIEKLKGDGKLFRKDQIMHSYPFCWRSDTPLLYKAVPSWFVHVEEFKDRLLKNNAETYWVPNFVKEKRFHNWLENAIDWNVSRNRYWGTPIPIWISDDGEEVVCIGSVEELERRSGVKVNDLHREHVDKITIPSEKGKGDLRRISEVFDCWFESGSMPYAQQHYPFEEDKKEVFEQGFPADFIAEGLDQTRGWFYTLMVLSTALFDRPAFKNLIVNGLVLADDGKKMSKRLKNYPDPQKIFDNYGADSLRLYLINSPVVRAEPLRFQEAGVLNVVKDVFLPWFNAFRFFAQNCSRLETTDDFTFDRSKASSLAESSNNIMDKWILAALHHLIKFVKQEMEAYRLYTVVPKLVDFIGQLTNWYVRLNRDRLKNVDNTKDDCIIALSTLYTVLSELTTLMAPFTPFFTEYLHQMLHVPVNVDAFAKDDLKSAAIDSVHFKMLPEPKDNLLNEEMELKMKHMQDVITLCRLARGNDVPLKRPIKELILVHHDQKILDLLVDVESYIKSEANIKSIVLDNDERKWCQLNAKADGRALGKKLGKKFKTVFKKVKELSHEELIGFQDCGKLDIDADGEIIALTEDDVKLERTVIVPKKDEHKFAFRVSDAHLSVIVNLEADEDLQNEFIARDFVSKVQKLRKTANVEVGDVLDVIVDVGEKDEKKLFQALSSQDDFILSKLKRRVIPKSAKIQVNGFSVGTVEDCVDGVKFKLELVRRGLLFLSGLKQEQAALLENLDFSWFEQNAKESFTFSVDGKEVTLKRGKDYFLDSTELPIFTK